MHQDALADFIELEREYRKAKVHATRFAVDNNVTEHRALDRALYRRLRGMFKPPSAYLRLAIKDAAETVKSPLEPKREELAKGKYPRIGGVSLYADQRVYSRVSLTVIEARLSTGRFELEPWPHRRFGWLSRIGEAERNTVRLKRVGSRVSIFTYEVRARREEPKAIIAFDVNENTIVTAKIDLVATAEKATKWNRRLIRIDVIRTDFGRIARRYPLGLNWPRNSATR
jgi:hypothetical protein